MNAKLFINYRRDDTRHAAGRLYDHLTTHFSDDQIFMDIDQIEPGEDFVEAINRKVSTCDIAIVLIGPNWLHATDESGKRRLDDEEDFVRMEIVAALERNIRVIPVLIDRAQMPRKHELPEALAPLSRRNAIELSETRFHADVNRLIEAIKRSLVVAAQGELSATPAAPSPEPESKELAKPSESPRRAEPKAPAVKSSIRGSAPKQRRRMPLVVGALGLLAGATLLVSVIVLKNQVQTGQKSGELSSSSESDQKGNAIGTSSSLVGTWRSGNFAYTFFPNGTYIYAGPVLTLAAAGMESNTTEKGTYTVNEVELTIQRQSAIITTSGKQVQVQHQDLKRETRSYRHSQVGRTLKLIYPDGRSQDFYLSK